MSANPVQAVIDHYERGEIAQSHQQLESVMENQQLNMHQTMNLVQLAYHIKHLDMVERIARGALQRFPGEYHFYIFLKRSQLETLKLLDALSTVEAARNHPHYKLNKPVIDSTYLRLNAYASAVKQVSSDFDAKLALPMDELPPPRNGELNIQVTERACTYVKHYKYNQRNLFEAAYKHLNNQQLNFDIHGFILFLTMHHMEDYGELFTYLPSSAEAVLNIGCGLGVSELLLRHHYGEQCHYSMIELEEMTHVEHHDGEAHPTRPLDKPLRPLEEAEHFLKANGFRDDQLTLCPSSDTSALNDKQFDLVYSARSWMYLYPMEVYWDLVAQTLKPEGVLIADIHLETGDLEKLRERFESYREVSGNDTFKRVVCSKIKR